MRLIADCPSTSEAEGLAQVEASGHTFAGRDPDAGGWWAADSGAVHRIEVAETWPPETGGGPGESASATASALSGSRAKL